jgi:internalin A
VVELLPPQAPDYQEPWRHAGDRPGHRELRVRYELGVMPPGIPTWFIAREHRFSTGLHWRTGVLLRDRSGLHLALLRADPEDKSVELAVRGPIPQGFLEILDDGLTLLLDRYPGLSVRRRIPCPYPVPGGCPAYFDSRRLVNRLAHGRDDDECDEYHRIPIQTLLAGITPTARDTGSLTEDALRRILAEELSTSQRSILKAIREMQRTHCPSVFTLSPSAKRRPGRTVHVLRLHCEEPDAWHALPGDDGTYEITELDPWLAKYGPPAARVLALIAKALPVAGSVAAISAHFLDGQLRQDLEDTRELLAHKIPSHLGVLDDPDPRRTLMPEQPEQPRARAETDADFRDLEAMLLTLDPDRHWGGLDRTITPEGTTLYLCEKHAQNYR